MTAYSFHSFLRGSHAYMHQWDPIIGDDSLVCQKEQADVLMNWQLRYCTTIVSWDTFLEILARGSIDFYRYHTLELDAPSSEGGKSCRRLWARGACYLSPARSPENN